MKFVWNEFRFALNTAAECIAIVEGGGCLAVWMDSNAASGKLTMLSSGGLPQSGIIKEASRLIPVHRMTSSLRAPLQEWLQTATAVPCSDMNLSMQHQLATYLNDHLAGSVAAIALIDDMISAVTDEALKSFLVQLKKEITEEQQVLRILLRANDLKEGALKKAAAWLGEKASAPKFGGGGDDNHGLAIMQGLEMLYLGITGKLLQWWAFQGAIAPMVEALGFDLNHLQKQAERQRHTVEEFRLAYARKAFAGAMN